MQCRASSTIAGPNAAHCRERRICRLSMALTNKAFKKLINDNTRSGTSIEPRCPHADQCGGCAFQQIAYPDQVAAKQAALQQLWHATGINLAIPVVASPDPYEYRTRMDYVATKGRFGLRMSGRFNYIVELETCHLIPPAAFHAAHIIWQRAMEMGLPDYNIRSHEGFLRYIVVRRSPQNTLLLAPVTASRDHEPEMQQLADLALSLPGVVGFHWLLNDTLTDLSFGTPIWHRGVTTLPMQVGSHTLHIGPNSFFQNNVHLLLPLLDAVRDAVASQPDAAQQHIADLYGGVGAIALHLAPHVTHVVGVESHPESSHLARYNIAQNNVSNATSVLADVVNFLRLQRPGSFATIVADPPRTGLGPEVCVELRRLAPRRIVYVSCNPLTQLEDIQQLERAYRLTSLVGYDMFPHTPHTEALAILDRI
ncbi:MAG: 23S rRNA (uracil(1939)-C(5))-methyltransferase RlmD [Chloroflexaceae bacterium]|nr:23S rRNA (uracil(1939)-C(5))-methyltransferase RlmD [Chloroflexaceae bacterium]